MSHPIKSVMTAAKLLELNIKEIPMLVDGFIQRTGIVGITGSSDVGKSSFLRQFALAIAQGDSHFLDFPLHVRSRKVIYISTEDLMIDIAALLRKQLSDPQEIDECLENLIFITDTSNLFQKLDVMMKEHAPDCVIVDAFTDIHTGDMNMSTSVRKPLNKFKDLAQKHSSLFVIMNHTTKSSEGNHPSKNNSLGSQGFEAKMRMLAELRIDKDDPSRRHLCIVKGNYLPVEEKQSSIVLEMDSETLTFHNTGTRVPYNKMVAKKDSLKSKWQERCCHLKEENPSRTVDEIFQLVKEEGFTGARSTVGNYLRNSKAIVKRNNLSIYPRP